MGSRLEKNSTAVRKRIEDHTFSDEGGEEYEASGFGGFSDYFRRKKIKLQNLDAEIRAASTEKPQIFKGVVAHVSGYTQPPLHVLHNELVQHGACFLQYLDSKTMATHIIASALPPKKTVDFSRYRIVKPAWVMDSIQAGKLLPWSDYRVIDEGPRQKTIAFDAGKMFSQNTQQSPLRYREQTQNSFYTSQFKGQRASENLSLTRSITVSTPLKSELETKLPDEIDDNDFALVDADALEDHSVELGIVPAQSEVAIDTKAEQVEEYAGTAAPVFEPADETDLIRTPDVRVGADSTAQSKSKGKLVTSEEHNAMLLEDPRIRKSSTANPDFLKQYYSESRLHHLSTWKAELKSRMQRLAAEKGASLKAVKGRPGARRYIMHVDFDSFFCAVSLKSAPDYVDKPAVVAHGTGTGSEIASCNYPAREFGVKNGMWMARALELCPAIRVLPYDFPAYEEASRQFYESILEVDGVVQSVSVDEALVDITSLVLAAAGSGGAGVDEGSIWREQAKADELALTLRSKIRAQTGCAVSVGIGGNVLQAKVALRKAKPAGQYQMKPEDVLDVLAELKVENLPGVAYSIGGKLEEIGVKYVKDIRQVSKERLSTALGPKTGEKLWEYARGIDRTEVGDQPIRKSVSAEVNWGIRFINQQEAEEFVYNLCRELESRLLKEQVKGKNLTMKIMRRALDAGLDPPKHLGHGRCDTFNKSVVFGVATHNAETIGREAVSILRSYKFSPGDLRGLGVQLTKLEPVKASRAAAPDGSQKRLSFGKFSAAPGSASKAKPDPIEEESRDHEGEPTPGRDVAADPIADDPLTPKKPRSNSMHPALALSRANEADHKAKTPLNVTGTQFIMPTNPDPGVIAELPPDIRSRLMAQHKKPTRLLQTEVQPSRSRSRTQSPALADEIPPDIDPEVFSALPEDMKAEVLASYGRGRGGQGLLPQSPRKDRVIHHPAPKKTPTKRGGGARGMWSRARERQHDADAKLLQTNFLVSNQRGAAEPANREDDGVGELDPEFLAELPEEVRREVIADHRRRRILAQRGRLNIQMPQRRAGGVGVGGGGGGAAAATAAGADDDRGDVLPGGQTRLQFPAPPGKATFTTSALTSVGEIKDMLSVWHRETQDEGPHHADVEVLEKYLAKVVVEERDMDKARRLVAWLDWVIEEDGRESKGKTSWRGALAAIKGEVQKAVKLRGLGPLNFG